MTVAPDVVEAAARALYEFEQRLEVSHPRQILPWEDLDEAVREEYRKVVRPLLAAAAPLIARAATLTPKDIP